MRRTYEVPSDVTAGGHAHKSMYGTYHSVAPNAEAIKVQPRAVFERSLAGLGMSQSQRHCDAPGCLPKHWLSAIDVTDQ